MAALWPLLMWLPVLEAFYHAKTGVQKDFTMKHCLGEIMGGKAHKMIIQYFFLKIKGVFSYLGMYVYSFFPKNTSVRLFGYVRLILFLPKVQVYNFGMYIYSFCPKFPPCTIKRVCTFISFLQFFHHVLSKGYV